MVDGPDSMAHVHPERSVETNSEIVMQRNEDTPQQITSPITSTISTIAVQSGETRVVIALLQVRNMYCILIYIIIIYIFYICYCFVLSTQLILFYFILFKSFGKHYLKIFVKIKYIRYELFYSNNS